MNETQSLDTFLLHTTLHGIEFYSLKTHCHYLVDPLKSLRIAKQRVETLKSFFIECPCLLQLASCHNDNEIQYFNYTLQFPVLIFFLIRVLIFLFYFLDHLLSSRHRHVMLCFARYWISFIMLKWMCCVVFAWYLIQFFFADSSSSKRLNIL